MLHYCSMCHCNFNTTVTLNRIYEGKKYIKNDREVGLRRHKLSHRLKKRRKKKKKEEGLVDVAYYVLGI